MTYIFMAVHYPWLEHGSDRVIGFSRWESREAFEAAMPGSGRLGDIVHDGESRPREYFHLEQPAVTQS
jgi:hypothetical protein